MFNFLCKLRSGIKSETIYHTEISADVFVNDSINYIFASNYVKRIFLPFSLYPISVSGATSFIIIITQETILFPKYPIIFCITAFISKYNPLELVSVMIPSREHKQAKPFRTRSGQRDTQMSRGSNLHKQPSKDLTAALPAAAWLMFFSMSPYQLKVRF